MKKIFAKRLREIRIENKESQRELAEQLNVHKSAVSFWENGVFFPKVEELIKIADYYEVTLDKLVGRD